MTILKRIGVLSCGKMMGALYALMGLIFGAIFSLLSLVGGLAGLASGEDQAIFGVLFGVGAIVILPILYGIFGFLGGLLTAFLYNVVAGIAGGVELQLQQT
ncbi:MAG TPA: hypothetical protein VGC93_15930 [Thermoanaerobaculia bacterium]|jgi:hypothetical protein